MACKTSNAAFCMKRLGVSTESFYSSMLFGIFSQEGGCVPQPALNNDRQLLSDSSAVSTLLSVLVVSLV